MARILDADDDPDIRRELKSDQDDMFAAVNALGQTLEEWNAESGEYDARFRRDEDWRDALYTIRKNLKKYHRHELLPARGWLAKWNVLTTRLLPMVSAYPKDGDMMYTMGKVLVFITGLPGHGVPNHELHLQPMREYVRVLSSHGEVFPSLLQLIAPVLDPRVPEKSDADLVKLDLVVTLFKQLLEVPNRPSDRGAACVVEQAALALDRAGVPSLLATIARLLDRRELRGVTVVLADFFFQLVRGQDPGVLHKAHKRAQAAAAVGTAKTPGAGSSSGGGGPAPGGSGAPSRRLAADKSKAPLTKAAIAAAQAKDPLGQMLNAQRSARDASFRLRSIVSQGDMRGAVVLGGYSAPSLSSSSTAVGIGGSGAGAGRVASNVLADVFRQQAQAQRAPIARKKREGRRGKHELPEAPITLDMRGGIGASLAVEGLGADAPDAAGLVDPARDVVYRTLLELLTPGVPLPTGKGAAGDGSASAASESAPSPSSPPAAGSEANAIEDEEDDSQAPSAFATLTAAMTSRFLRDSDELEPRDILRYLHLTGVAMGVWRAREASRIADAEAKLAKEFKAAGASAPSGSGPKHGAVLSPRESRWWATHRSFDGMQLANLLDRWSLGQLVTLVDGYMERKQWQAVEIVAGHIKEVVLLVLAMVEHGDEPTAELGGKVFDALFRDRELLDVIPKVLRSWEPLRYSGRFLRDMLECVHYGCKLAERAAAAGAVTTTQPRRRKKKAASGNGSGAEGDDDEGNLGGIKGSRKSKSGYDGPSEPSEFRFELERFVGDFLHPTVLQAYTAALGSYARNGPKVNHYIVHFLRRMASLPNDMAGTDPSTGKPLTFEVMLYHWSLLDTVNGILNDRTIAASKEHGDLRSWAASFSSHFLRDSAVNPFLFVEALFWRGDKTTNGAVANHYGLVDGSVGAAEAAYAAALGHKRKGKTALARDEAQAEARRNALRTADEEEEAQAEFDLEDRSDGGRRKARRRADGGGKKKARGRKLQRDGAARGSSYSSTSGSSSSSGSSSDSDSSGGSPAKKLRAAAARGSGSDSDGDKGSDDEWPSSRLSALRSSYTATDGLVALSGVSTAHALARLIRDWGLPPASVGDVRACLEDAVQRGLDPLALSLAWRETAASGRRSGFAADGGVLAVTPASLASASKRCWQFGVAASAPAGEEADPLLATEDESRADAKAARIGAAARAVLTALGPSKVRPSLSMEEDDDLLFTAEADDEGGGGYASDTDRDDGDAAVSWVRGLLRRVAYARLNAEAAAKASRQQQALAGVGGGDLTSPQGAESAATAAGLTRVPAPAVSDTAIIPFTPAQAAWLSAPTVQALLRETGAQPAGGHAGEAWWRIPLFVPPAALLAAAGGIRS